MSVRRSNREIEAHAGACDSSSSRDARTGSPEPCACAPDSRSEDKKKVGTHPGTRQACRANAYAPIEQGPCRTRKRQNTPQIRNLRVDRARQPSTVEH